MILQIGYLDIYLMKSENKITVADAKQIYLQWNKSQHEKLSEKINSDACRYIQLIPLFLQLNNKLLPGFLSADAPVGTFSYSPDSSVLNEAKSLNNKFHYHQEGVIKNYSIDSIFFRRQLINKKMSCWVFYDARLNKDQVSSLKEKIKKIASWFSSKDLNVEFLCLSIEEFHDEKTSSLVKKNKEIFLDYFYSEIILLAGKYPVWWLVPPEKETEYKQFVEHIKQVRYVDNEEFIDLGSTAIVARKELVEHAIGLVQKIKQDPEICFIKILLTDQKNVCWPVLDGVATRLKKITYEGGKSANTIVIVAEILHDAFSRYAEENHILSPIRLFSHLRNMPGKLNLEIIDAFLVDSYVQESSVNEIDNIISYLNFSKALFHEMRQIFSNIITQYNAETGVTESDQSFTSVMRNMLVFLSENNDRVALYNNKDKTDIIFDRILLKHEIINNSDDRWGLVLEVSEGNEKTLEGFSSLLGLLAWCWLNRVVNNSTQVSIDCPKQQVKQIEALSVLEVLIQQLNLKLLENIPPKAFESAVKPLQSLLFVNFTKIEKTKKNKLNAADDPLSFGKQSTNLVKHFEQLIINSWGEVYTKKYTGNAGILNCLCEWTHHAPVNELAKPKELMIFGYGAGDSTQVAQRIEQVYEEMKLFFYFTSHEAGRFIIRMATDYYVVTANEGLLKSSQIGSKKMLIKYLEAPLVSFKTTALERLAYSGSPLKNIYTDNKKNILQIYFQAFNRNCYCWIMDEKGTLWSDEFHVFDSESFITQWLYFFRNIKNKLVEFGIEENNLPVLEINQLTNNQLGGVEIDAIGSESITGSKNFIEVEINIKENQAGDQLNLVCDGVKFEYSMYKNNVLNECVQYLMARIEGEGRRAVYVTDINIPSRMLKVNEKKEIQVSHFLKFKRSFEHRINKLLDG